MLSELHSAHKVIGVKQTKKAIKDGRAAMVYVALDAEKRVLRNSTKKNQCRTTTTAAPTSMPTASPSSVIVVTSVTSIPCSLQSS